MLAYLLIRLETVTCTRPTLRSFLF